LLRIGLLGFVGVDAVGVEDLVQHLELGPVIAALVLHQGADALEGAELRGGETVGLAPRADLGDGAADGRAAARRLLELA
jgi:hypothetical protein